MNRTTSKRAVSVRLDQQAEVGVSHVSGVTPARRTGGVFYNRDIAASRQLFAAPPVDLTTLVIAQEIRRKAQAELQREALRDTAYQYEMPVSRERDDESGARTNPAGFDE